MNAILPRICTVLLAEDEAILRLSAAKYLEEGGFRVLQAGSGEAALGFLKSDQVDVIFTDIRLGGKLNGWDVALAFREKYPEIPVIYTSGYMFLPPRFVEDSMFFSKPYDLDNIEQACRSLTAALH